MSWLLMICLENLGALDDSKTATATVRIECLQIVATMGNHFNLLKANLRYISRALEIAFKDANAEVRFKAVRCLDTLAHSMSLHLLNEGTQFHTKI